MILARVKQCIPISGKCAVQDHAKDATANELADSDREHQKWERECYPISVAEDKRYDQRIREDRRQRQQERVLVPHPVYEDSSNQCCETAEDNIRQDRASEDVADQTPDEETRYSGWGESGKNCECLGNADLDFTEAKWCQEPGYNDIDSGDHCGMSNPACLMEFHVIRSFLYSQKPGVCKESGARGAAASYSFLAEIIL